MHLRRRIALTSITFIVISIALTFVLALLSDYKYNFVTYTGDVEQRKQLEDDLNIDDKYFLLTPKLYLNYRLNNLEYIDSSRVDRVLPNEVNITYKMAIPSFCDSDYMYFTNLSLEKDVNNESICLGIPEIVNYTEFTEYTVFVEEFKSLSIDFRYNILSTEVIDNYYRFIMTDDLVIDVFLNDFNKLNSYDEYISTNGYLDLRPKYS